MLLSFAVAEPERNLNWLWRPFEKPQTLMPPVAFLALMTLLCPLVLYLPTHVVLRRLSRVSDG